ncbi:MAG: hypothetical protein FJW86_01915 [Actinobacteria bacterium]|nr:hypothetical protein [Actinomycetota bacterium]
MCRLRWIPHRSLFAAALMVVVSACVPLPPQPPPTSTSTTTTASPTPANVFEAACAESLVALTSGVVASGAITELSGLAVSRRQDGVQWAHNDSGDSARVFALGADGRDLGQYSLSGASAVDWEDLAVGPGPSAAVSYLYVGDIGDNAAARASVQVYRVPEPDVDPAAGTPAPQALTDVARLTLTYPDTPHNAETMLVDPVSGELYIVTKSSSGIAQVFRAPANLADGTTTTLVQVGAVSLGSSVLVTAGDVTASGDVVALRTYSSVVLFPRPSGASLADAFTQTPCSGAVVPEAQGEALAFTSDGRGYITASEGAFPELHRFTMP